MRWSTRSPAGGLLQGWAAAPRTNTWSTTFRPRSLAPASKRHGSWSWRAWSDSPPTGGRGSTTTFPARVDLAASGAAAAAAHLHLWLEQGVGRVCGAQAHWARAGVHELAAAKPAADYYFEQAAALGWEPTPDQVIYGHLPVYLADTDEQAFAAARPRVEGAHLSPGILKANRLVAEDRLLRPAQSGPAAAISDHGHPGATHPGTAARARHASVQRTGHGGGAAPPHPRGAWRRCRQRGLRNGSEPTGNATDNATFCP